MRKTFLVHFFAYSLFGLLLLLVVWRALNFNEKWKLWELRSIPEDSIYLWTVDFHASPAACNLEIYKEAGAYMHAEVDYPNCGNFPVTCKKRLKVLSLDKNRGFSLDPRPLSLKRSFFQAYKADPEFERLDAIVCSHPAANCELFLPFNKSLIVYATTRIEFGRFDENIDWRVPYINDTLSKSRWSQWLNNLVVLANDEKNVVAANNLYDVFAIEYYTGIKALYLPSWCLYPDDVITLPANGSDTSATVVLAPYRDNLETWDHPIYDSLAAAISESKTRFRFEKFRHLYPTYKSLHVLKAHPCIVLIPYQVSFMSFFEYYRLGVPLYAPSKKLLLQWDNRYDIMWERMYGNVERERLLDPLEKFKNRWMTLGSGRHRIDAKLLPSQYRDFDAYSQLPNPALKSSFNEWVDFCDFYNFPHVQTFDSWPDLIEKIKENELNGRHSRISSQMKNFSSQQRESLVEAWRIIFDQLKKDANPGSREIPPDYEAGLKLFYGKSRVFELNQNVDLVAERE